MVHKKKIIIWGASGQALVLEEILRKEFDILVFFDNQNLPSPIDKIPLFVAKKGFENWKKTNSSSLLSIYFAVAIGGGNGKDRLSIHQYLKSNGLVPLNIIHSTAFVAYNAEIGEGVQILANSSVCVKVILGKSVIVNTAAIIDHECIIGEGVHIGPGAHLAGLVSVGKNSFIGTGAVILPRIKIGENCIIGAGSVITKDIGDNIVGYGNPFIEKGKSLEL